MYSQTFGISCAANSSHRGFLFRWAHNQRADTHRTVKCCSMWCNRKEFSRNKHEPSAPEGMNMQYEREIRKKVKSTRSKQMRLMVEGCIKIPVNICKNSLGCYQELMLLPWKSSNHPPPSVAEVQAEVQASVPR